MPDADKLMARNSEEAGKTTCRSMRTWTLVHVCTICSSIWVCCRTLNIPTQTAPTGALLCRRTTETVKTFQVGPQQTWTGKWKVQHRSTLSVMVPSGHGYFYNVGCCLLIDWISVKYKGMHIPLLNHCLGQPVHACYSTFILGMGSHEEQWSQQQSYHSGDITFGASRKWYEYCVTGWLYHPFLLGTFFCSK